MTAINLTKKNEFQARWKTAVFHTHEGEYLKATLARDIWALLGDDKTLAYEWLHENIAQSASTKRMLFSMRQVIDVVSDRRVWIAVGWAGVNQIAGMSQKARDQKIKEILRAAEKADGGRVNPKDRARLLPKPAAKPTEPTADHVLAEELRRLVADPALGPLLRAHLSARAAKLVAAKKSA